MKPAFPLLLAVAVLFASCGGSAGGASDPTVSASDARTAAATTATPATAATPGAPTPQVATGPAEHDGQRALAHVVALSSTIGPRVSGTRGEDAAVAYISGQFRSSGYEVEVMQFTFEGDRFTPATVQVAGGTSLEAMTLAGSGSGTVSAPGVYVGLADASGIAGRSLAGKIAIADRGTLRFSEKYDNVTAAGALGLIIVNNQAGSFSGNLGKDVAEVVVAVPQEAGAALRAAATSGKAISIEAQPRDRSESVNVIARAPGTKTCEVVVGGHHDTVPDAPGANDNASGSANVIELARAFAADGLDAGLCFVTFGAEESGLFGSKAFADRLTAEKALPAYMVNLDVTGIGKEVEVIGTNEMKARALRIAEQAGISARASSLPANTGSDHQSFTSAGVPVVYFSSGDFGTIHSPLDVASDMSASELDLVGDLAYAVILDLLKNG
ncbi:MAG: M20/M25/M40 family metallo-hydrolase [Chloroflexi bacterium]|nr:M20/M25/M40 family metallo-hydrolase [Chloroflexota bacterium]